MKQTQLQSQKICAGQQADSVITANGSQRPSWAYIYYTEIEPLRAKYGVVIECNSIEDESCAIFYDDITVGEYDHEASTGLSPKLTIKKLQKTEVSYLIFAQREQDSIR